MGGWQLALAQEPVGREHQTLGSLCQFQSFSVANPRVSFSLPEDIGLAICVIQLQLWKEARSMQDSTSSFIASRGELHQGIVGGSKCEKRWEVYLNAWKSAVRQVYDSKGQLSTQNLGTFFQFTAIIQCHMSFLRLYADIALIQRLVDGLKDTKYSPSVVHSFELQIQLWAKSTQAQQALWHAAQILRHFKENYPDVRNSPALFCPSGPICLSQAAQVVWSICRSTLTCDLCEAFSTQHHNTRQTHRPRVNCDLLELKDSTEMAFWNNNIVKLSIANIPFCACKISAILNLYIKALHIWGETWSTAAPLADTISFLKQQP